MLDMLNTKWARGVLAAAALGLTLSGCGGGGGGGSGGGGGTGGTPTAVVLSGVAAEGAPMDNASIRLLDATGAVVATAEAGADGAYTIQVPATAKAPLVLSASKEDITFYAPVAEAKTGTINVTKLTNLIAAQMSPTGDPSALAQQIASGAATVNTAQVQQVVAAIMESLAPLLQNVGSTTDPLTGTFAADGSGHDKLLMALDVAIQSTGTASNITVTVKAATVDGEQPPSVSFTSGDTPPPLPQAVATAQLPASDTDAMVAGLMARLEACYALPRTERVNGATAASVIAPACRGLFTQDDPTKFKNNGAGVGANGAFSGLFRDTATGVKFTSPVIEFLVPDGKMLVSWKNTGSDGSISYARVWVARENGALKAIGNGYSYPFTVRAWSETRDLLNRTELSYWATGFDVSVGNLTSGGTPIFDRVVVTTPNGRQLTLRPSAGLSYVPIEGTSTSVVRLAGKFMNAGTTGVPRRLSGIANGENLVWATNPADNSATDWSESQIKAINNVGRWKAEFYLATNPATIAATQYHETMARPLTVAELMARQWPTLSAQARTDVVAESASTGNVALAEGDVVDLSVSGSPADFWTVPTGAHGPTLVQAQGFVAGTGTPPQRWNDNLNVGSLARKATITCSRQSGADVHCSSITAGTYSANARINLLQMFAYDARDMEWVTTLPTYLLPGIN